MFMKMNAFAVALAATFVSAAAFAQQGQPLPASPNDAPKATVNQRQENQQKRIAQGVQSGQLTPGETARIERKEQAIHQQVQADRRLNGGKLTPAERQQVNHEQNSTSRQIHHAKHNGKVAGM